MSNNTEHASSLQQAGTRIYSSITLASRYVTYTLLTLLMLVMLLEVVMRYFANSPLGWNVSLIEKVILPGIVFLGLPWAYAVSSHVTADMVYNRMPERIQAFCRVMAIALLALCTLFLLIAGTSIAVEAFVLGSAPPPLSSQVPIPTWIWRAFLPIGALLMLVLVLIDVLRWNRSEEPKS